MRGMTKELEESSLLAEAAPGSIRGRVVGFGRDLRPLVEWPEQRSGPAPAHALAHCRHDLQVGSEVLLIFERRDPAVPIVVGVISDSPANLPLKVSVDGKSVLLESHEELTLKCGQSSIVLRGDGRIVIKGAEIVSRASGTNKIRGSCVKIN
jgi:hypothetical protein